MRFEYSAEVGVSPDEVFALTQDYARRLPWDVFLREAVILDGATKPAVVVCALGEAMGLRPKPRA